MVPSSGRWLNSGMASPGESWTLNTSEFPSDGAANDTVDAGYLIPEATHSLRVEGFDASEDGTGRGTPLVPEVSGPLGAQSGGFRTTDLDTSGAFIPERARSGTAHGTRIDTESETFVVNAREDPVTASGKSLPLGAKDTGHAIGFIPKNSAKTRSMGEALEPAPTLDSTPAAVACADTKRVGTNQTTGGPTEVCAQHMQVRRLTPTECERLQGFPDNFTRIAWRGKAPEDCPDGPRYKALGNSMAVSVMAWIGKRIEEVDAL